MITINGQQIAAPGSVEVGKFKLTRSARTVSGRMVMDIIATKRKVELGWSHISEPDLRLIEDLLDAAVFHQVTYPDPQGAGGLRTMTAYVGDITKRLWHKRQGVRYWENVRLALIEQ